MPSHPPTQRVLCLVVPLFPLAARLRCEPELLEEAVAIFQGSGSAARLIAATRRARRGALRPGMTLSQARALLPKLHVRARDTECEKTAQEALLEVAESFSPRFEDAGEGVVYLDIQGLERHYPLEAPISAEGTGMSDMERSETALGRELMAKAERRAGLPAWAGIASSKLGARIAAERLPSPTIVPIDRETDFLAPLPLAHLAPEAHVYETLSRWGIRSIGSFAALSANEITGRLGKAGQELHQRARGIDPRPIVPHQPGELFHEGMELDWPLNSLEPFLFVARAALDRLCARLDARGLACIQLELSLRLEPDGFCERSILLPAPSRDAKTLLTLIRLDLEREAPGAPVIGFTFKAHPDRPRAAQLTLFGPTALSPDKLATSLARLFALLGSDGIGRPTPIDSHLPSRFEILRFEPPAPPPARPEVPRSRGLLAVRCLRPPIPLVVRSVAGTILTVRSRAQSASALRLGGRIRVASGPWSVEENWWSERETTDRAYWDIELESGGIYRIYRNQITGDWFADGIYD